MNREDARDVIMRVAVVQTGYGHDEAAAWSRGVVDAYTLDRPGYFMAFDQQMVEQLAERLVAR